MYKSPGFSPELEKEHAKEEDYEFLGASKLSAVVLLEDGDWRPYRPTLEVQRNNYFDSYSCVSFANNNITEFMHNKRYGKEINYSDRYCSVVSGTKPGVGNSHKGVAEARRACGSVLESECPFPATMTQSQFFAPVTAEMRALGAEWKLETEYGYETVPRSKFMKAMPLSPLQVAVDSRTNKTSQVRGLDHSVVIEWMDEAKKQIWVFDSYLNHYQTYDWNYPFGYAQRYHYKQNIILNIDDMELRLIKGSIKPDIYLSDFEGVLHHVQEPDGFEKIFSKTAWDKFVTLNQSEVDAMPVGVPISIKGQGLLEALKNLINSLGRGNK